MSKDETKVGRFTAGEELGRGGMGRIVEGLDPDLQRWVAVKVALPSSQAGPKSAERFLTEARITAQLEHPGIVPVYELGESAEGEQFFAMRKVEGRSLGELLDGLSGGDPELTEHWTLRRLLGVFEQVCNAVAYAHSRRVLHRDLKPENIMLGAFGEVLVMDWGVARVLDGPVEEITHDGEISGFQRAMTMDGASIGTLGFMSPEQAKAELEELDERSDVWSLCAVLYELLTLEHAYDAEEPMAILFQVFSGPPTLPRERAPDRRIPAEIEAICMKGLATEREDRWGSAEELAEAVRSFLDGSERRRQAASHLERAHEARERHRRLTEEREELSKRVRRLADVVPWTPLDQKRDLIEAEERQGAVDHDIEAAFAEAVGAAQRALSQDPDGVEARAFLADAWWERLERAEAERDESGRRFAAAQLAEYDDGAYAALLAEPGRLRLHTDPDGADVVLERLELKGLVWPLVQRRELGRTPLVDVLLEPGSYVLTLSRSGHVPVRYPLLIERGRVWDTGLEPVRLLTADELGVGWTYVPGGPFICGGGPELQHRHHEPRRTEQLDGFLIRTTPVTMGEYCRFINAVHELDPDEAWRRVPRQEAASKESVGQYWERPGPGRRYAIPKVDRDGDVWDPSWPAAGISWHDAAAYALWISQETGVRQRLPTEHQWEKAARGVDGRRFPWGDGYDATLCCHAESRPGPLGPSPVGAWATDASVYAARDFAGGVKEWCADETFGPDPERRPCRGGSWFTHRLDGLTFDRQGVLPRLVSTHLGFRLARDLPDWER